MKVKLLKAWGPNKAGAEVEVDPARAEKLRQDGYTVKEKPKGKEKG